MISTEPPLPGAQPAVSARMRRFLWVALFVAVVGAGGYELVTHYGAALGRHVVHVVLLGGASLAFIALALSDIHHNGKPRFSWRLNSR